MSGVAKFLIKILFISQAMLLAGLQNSTASDNTKNLNLADVIETLIPTVVNIHTVRERVKESEPGILSNFLENNRIKNFTRNYNITLSSNKKSANIDINSLGSGIIISEDGFIMTNYHVITNASEILVKLANNEEFAAHIIGFDPETDLALLKIKVENKLPFAKFADSNNFRVGDTVIAIGNPFGFSSSVTTGIISHKARDLLLNNNNLVDNFIQTDAAIHSGSSGGALFNLSGQLIGINTSIPEINDGKNVGIGFAIPANTARTIMLQLKEHGKITRSKLDITVQQITAGLAETFNLQQRSGLLIVNVNENGNGYNAGLRTGDVVIKCNDIATTTARKLELLVAELKIGEKVDLTIIRDNKEQNIEVKVSIPEYSNLL